MSSLPNGTAQVPCSHGWHVELAAGLIWLQPVSSAPGHAKQLSQKLNCEENRSTSEAQLDTIGTRVTVLSRRVAGWPPSTCHSLPPRGKLEIFA